MLSLSKHDIPFMERSMFWDQKSTEEIRSDIFGALEKNQSYYDHSIIGLPGTSLDPNIFPVKEPFLKKAPFLKSLIENPNHIGVHTLSETHKGWEGSQAIELDVLRICAEEILQAKPNSYDGYIPTGGTEANIQAMWMYRNYYQKTYDLSSKDITMFYSEDSHYSMPKGGNLLQLSCVVLPVDKQTREIDLDIFEQNVQEEVKAGKRHFIFVLNLGTTMFGSVDKVAPIVTILKKYDVEYKLHVDAAFGGFVYPFTNEGFEHHFGNPEISSISLDAHKMLQAPYGTGIFICKKGLIKYVETEDAGYIQGHDHTICGSRSGANVIAIWMILNVYGSGGFQRRIKNFWARTNYLCKELDDLNVRYFRDPYMNIVTIYSEYVTKEIAEEFFLVPETHTEENRWWKVVVMDHVSTEIITQFLTKLQKSLLKLRGA